MEVIWSDGHESVYKGSWLQSHSFNVQSQTHWLQSSLLPYRTWNTDELTKEKPQLSFKDVLGSDSILLKFLQHLQVTGLCLLVDVPDSLGQVRILADRVAFIRKTHYG